MLVLRADPWDPDFGMSYEAQPAESQVQGIDPTVEGVGWNAPIQPPEQVNHEILRFVDGVRRVDLGLIAEEGERRVPGLFGSFAVGCVERDGRAAFGEYQVGRALVVGGGLRGELTEVQIGTMRLGYLPSSVPGSEPDRPLWGLQQQMRDAEGVLAARAAADERVVVLIDGPLTFRDPTAGAVVGVVKRSVRAYLEPKHEALVGRLHTGQRTPLFGVGTGDQPIDRYAWYTRLVPRRPAWHDHAGVVRCEVREGVGLETAISLADRVSSALPAFAGRTSDPRAPQNLAPVGALERHLKHRMGHAGMIRRALTATLQAQAEGTV